MGGYGSGRWGTHVKKNTVEDCRSLDTVRWTRDKLLEDGAVHAGGWRWTDASTGEERASIGYEVNTAGPEPPYVRLHYKLTRSGEDLDYKVLLETTHPRLGGLRWWFICPLVMNRRTCGRRVGKLYLPPGGRYFGCRHCYDLSYESSQASNSHMKRRLLRMVWG